MGYSPLRYRKRQLVTLCPHLDRREREANTDVQITAFVFYLGHGVVLPHLGCVFQSQLTNVISHKHAKKLVF